MTIAMTLAVKIQAQRDKILRAKMKREKIIAEIKNGKRYQEIEPNVWMEI